MRSSRLNAAAHIYEKHIRERQAARGRAPTSVPDGRSGNFFADFNSFAHFDKINSSKSLHNNLGSKLL
jgi:hypothetical protein